jgi:hypothetical protein
MLSRSKHVPVRIPSAGVLGMCETGESIMAGAALDPASLHTVQELRWKMAGTQTTATVLSGFTFLRVWGFLVFAMMPVHDIADSSKC